MKLRKLKPRKYLLFGIMTITAVLFTACQKLDVIGNGSVKSLEAILTKASDKVSESDNYWSLTAPDGSADFYWSKDFSATDYDAYVSVDAKPFLNAGLNFELLPKEVLVKDQKLIFGMDFGTDNYTYEDSITPTTSYEQFVTLKRSHISHHGEADHYGIDLGNGNKFEWARDLNENDKDIVFVLDPQVLIEAGVNPNEVQGWIYTIVKTMDMDGSTTEVHKFLKPFDIN